jgi:hypothetical protein
VLAYCAHRFLPDESNEVARRRCPRAAGRVRGHGAARPERGVGDRALTYPDGESFHRDAWDCHEDATAALFAPGGPLRGPNLRAVLPLGDLQYPSADLATFTYPASGCSIVPPFGTAPCSFGRSWADAAAAGPGRVPFRPTPGNHEYSLDSTGCRLASATPSGQPYGACGYNAFWGDRVAAPRARASGDGDGSYAFSFDVSSAHPMLFVSVNVGQCELNESACSARSRLVSWLARTLADPALNPPGGCVALYWHQAAWDYVDHGDLMFVWPVWRAMFDRTIPRTQRPDLVLNGHDHVYERYDPLDRRGEPGTARPSIPEIVVGTGGRNVNAPLPAPPLQSAPPAAIDGTHFGVERVAWSPTQGRIDAGFVHAEDGSTVDRVTYPCHGAATVTGSP